RHPTTRTAVSSLSLHDALPISARPPHEGAARFDPSMPRRPTVKTPAPRDAEHRAASYPTGRRGRVVALAVTAACAMSAGTLVARSEEHTSELQSRENLVCRLLL